MQDDNSVKVINRVINNYLETHSSIRCLFNEQSDSVEMVSFFGANFNAIYETAINLFREDKEMQNGYYIKCLNYIKLDFDDFIEKRRLKSYQKRLLVATMIYSIVSRDLKMDELSIDNWNLIHNDGKQWYRGQADCQWHLIPSMFRNLGNIFPKEKRIDMHEIEQIYTNNGMLKRWEQVFNSSEIDYRFLSYMQHSISYSPLLDFSSSFPTAVSFSLCNRSSINNFAYKDSSVFQIEVSNDRLINPDVDNLPNNFFINYIPNKYTIGTSILGKPITSYDDFLRALTPEYVMIDTVNNDRMRYQNGRFIFFYNYLSLQGMVCTWLNKDLHVTKYRIRKEEKNKYCDQLREEYPYLMVDKMMNPYNYFSDQ